MGHLNGILARVGGNLNKKIQKSQMPGGLPGGSMLKLRFDRYIRPSPLFFVWRRMRFLILGRSVGMKKKNLKKKSQEGRRFGIGGPGTPG